MKTALTLFSSPARYDHFDTAPSVTLYNCRTKLSRRIAQFFAYTTRITLLILLIHAQILRIRDSNELLTGILDVSVVRVRVDIHRCSNIRMTHDAL